MTMPTPPYPTVDNPILASIVKQALAKFEQGEVSVAGAIMAAAHSTWAVGHQEGEDLCVGCTHRPMTLPGRAAPHAKCFILAISIMQQSLQTYIETWILMVKRGVVRFPQTEEETRAMFRGIQNTFEVFKLLSEQATKKGPT